MLQIIRSEASAHNGVPILQGRHQKTPSAHSPSLDAQLSRLLNLLKGFILDTNDYVFYSHQANWRLCTPNSLDFCWTDFIVIFCATTDVSAQIMMPIGSKLVPCWTPKSCVLIDRNSSFHSRKPSPDRDLPRFLVQGWSL